MPKKFWITALLFALLVALKLHGFSWGMWSGYVGGDPAVDFQIGRPQGSRSDDWAAVLPMTFAQIAHDPKFPTINRNYGYPSATVRAEFPMPSRAWETAFRPHLWGFFLGGDFGMAWEWWFRIFALILSAMLVAEHLIGCDVLTSFALAGAFATAPFFSFWSYNLEPCASTALLILYALHRLSEARNWKQTLSYTTALAYLGLMMAFGISYPAYQVQFIWFSLITAVVLVVHLRLGRSRFVVSLAVAGLIAGAGVALYVWKNVEALKIVLGTVYPGARDLRGGELSFLRLFLNNLVVFSKTSVNWAQFGSTAEAAGFLHLFPLSILLIFWQRQREAKNSLLIITTVFTIVVLGWAFIRWPAPIARVSLWNRVPGNRLMIGLGVIEFLWLALICRKSLKAAFSTRQALALALITFGVMIGLSVWGQSQAPLTILLRRWIPASLLIVALAWFLAMQPRVVPWIILSVNIFTAVNFNPLARGGYAKLRESRIVQALLKEQEHAPQARWVVLGDTIAPNLLRAYGIPAINGVHFAPAWPLWKQLDPQGQLASVYNRYAYVALNWPVQLGAFTIESPNPDTVVMDLHPDDPRFLALNVDHLLLAHSIQKPRFRNWELVDEPLPGNQLYRKLRPSQGRPEADSL